MANTCENCKFRAHYDKKPKSALGRFGAGTSTSALAGKATSLACPRRKKLSCARNTTSPSIDFDRQD